MRANWKEQSKTFNEAASYYDRYRPSYPEALIEAIAKKTGLIQDSKVLEIGAGSGKATELFVPYGCELTCIEPGKDLVEKGIEKFRDIGRVKYYQGRFEEWAGHPNHYDLIISAQAFHWVPQPIGYEKCHIHLKKGKNLALFWNYYLSNEEPIDKELQELLDEYPIMYIADDESITNRINSVVDEIRNSGYFQEAEVLKYPWIQRYSIEEYIGFVRTGNGYLSLGSEEKSIVEKRIRDILTRHGGYIDRPYLCVICQKGYSIRNIIPMELVVDVDYMYKINI